MTFLAPAVCFFWGIWAAVYTFYRWKNWGIIKLSTLILAIIWIPTAIAMMLQYFQVINYDFLAKSLGSAYYTQWITQNQKTSRYKLVFYIMSSSLDRDIFYISFRFHKDKDHLVLLSLLV